MVTYFVTLSSMSIENRFQKITPRAESSGESTGMSFDDKALLVLLPKLRSYALKLARNTTLANDLVQETCRKAIENKHTFKEGSNLYAWLCTILRNTLMDTFRRGKHEVEDVDSMHAQKVKVEPNQISHMYLQDVLELLANEEKFEPRERQIIELKLRGLTLEEIAKELEMPLGTVKNQDFRTREKLKVFLGEKKY